MELFIVEMIDKEDVSYLFKATLDPSHPIFEGHFPGNPVVPGVCTLAMIKRCCGVALGREVRFATIKEVKFLATILPDQHRELSVKVEFKEEMNIAVVVEYAEKIMMKLRATITSL